MRITCYFMASFFFAVALSAEAAPSRTPAPTPDAIAASVPPAVLPTAQSVGLEQRLLEQEAKHLREQNSAIESYHESVLTTSYFALGTALTITLLLLGYSWWFNSRAYESDKKAFRDELNTKISSAESRIALKEQEQRSASEVALNARIDAANSANTTIYNELRSDLKDTRAASELAAGASAEKVDLLSREFRMVEDMVWDQRGVHSNGLLSLAQGLELCATDDDDDFFDVFVDRLKRRFAEVIESGHKLTDHAREGIERRLAASLERRPEKIQQLMDLLAKVESQA